MDLIKSNFAVLGYIYVHAK